jgi:hypothetical protein
VRSAEEAEAEAEVPHPRGARAHSEEGIAEGDEPSAEGDCAAALRASTPGTLRTALSALGWSTVYADACLAEAARDAGDPAACDALSVRALREHCRDQVAIQTEQPLVCSTTGEGEADEAHDPLCLALAARHRGLCRSVPLARRALCEGLLGDGVERCERSDVPDHEGCQLAYAELSPFVTGPFVTAPATARRAITPHLSLRTVRVVELGAHVTREEPVNDDLSDAERGAVLRWVGCDALLTLGSETAEPLSRRTQVFVEVRLPIPSPEGPDEATAPIEVPATEVPFGEGARVAIERNAFGRAEGGGFSGGTGSVHVEPFALRLGSELSLRVEGDLSRLPGHVEVLLEARTVLRDVVGARAEGCAEGAR